MKYECHLCGQERGDTLLLTLGSDKIVACHFCAILRDFYCPRHCEARKVWPSHPTDFICLSCVDEEVSAIGPHFAREIWLMLENQLTVTKTKKVVEYWRALSPYRPNLSAEERVLWGLVVYRYIQGHSLNDILKYTVRDGVNVDSIFLPFPF